MTWSANSVTVYTAVVNQGETFAITDTKLYVLVVTLWSQEKCKAIRSSKTKFKKTLNKIKYRLKESIERHWWKDFF